jgi:excisionase family DNA binding protein
MANRTRSRQQINSRRRPKRSKPHRQSTPNRHSDRTNLMYAPDTQSLSASDAAGRLGVSVSTVKRMCGENKLASFRTRGPRGHLRIPVEAVEKLRQGGRTETVPVSSAVAAKRANADELRADLEVRKLELEVRKLDSQESVAARERVEVARAQRLTAKAQLKAVKLQAARDAERRSAAAQAEERANWRRGWFNGAVQEFPNWVSPEQDRELRTAIDAELDRWDVADGDAVVGPALDRVIERTIAPWAAIREERAQREKLVAETIGGYVLWGASAEQKTRAAEDARAALLRVPFGASAAELKAVLAKAIAPVLQGIADDRTHSRREQLIKSAGQWLPWGATETEQAQATQAVRSALGGLPLHANQVEEQALLTRTLTPIKKAIEERATAQQERQRREGQKPFLITVAVLAASAYLSELRSDLDPEPDGEEFSELERQVEAKIRSRLGQELTGDESQQDANSLACEIVDEEVLEEEELE